MELTGLDRWPRRYSDARVRKDGAPGDLIACAPMPPVASLSCMNR
jgi:hypothetical protein